MPPIAFYRFAIAAAFEPENLTRALGSADQSPGVPNVSVAGGAQLESGGRWE
jgi:hypothetical protein